MRDLSELCFEPIDVEKVDGIEDFDHVYRTLLLIARRREELSSALEILLESIKRCTGLIDKVGFGRYVYAGYET